MSAHGKFKNPIGILEFGNTKEKRVAATRRASARVMVAGAIAARDRSARRGLSIPVDMACDLETRLPGPTTQPSGAIPAREHDHNHPLPPADRFGAVPMPVQWTADEGYLLAGRERGAG